MSPPSPWSERRYGKGNGLDTVSSVFTKEDRVRSLTVSNIKHGTRFVLRKSLSAFGILIKKGMSIEAFLVCVLFFLNAIGSDFMTEIRKGLQLRVL
jgi:hypothetical protein